MTLRFTLLLALLLPLGTAQRAGEPAPDFTLLGQDGEVVRLADLQGVPVVLNIWATWCAPCIEELPLLQEASQALNAGEAPRVVFLLVNNNENPDAARRFLLEQNIDLLAGFDAVGAERQALSEPVDATLTVMRRYRVRGMPTTFFIDAQGVIRSIKLGLVTPEELSEHLGGIGVDWQPD